MDISARSLNHSPGSHVMVAFLVSASAYDFDNAHVVLQLFIDRSMLFFWIHLYPFLLGFKSFVSFLGGISFRDVAGFRNFYFYPYYELGFAQMEEVHAMGRVSAAERPGRLVGFVYLKRSRLYRSRTFPAASLRFNLLVKGKLQGHPICFLFFVWQFCTLEWKFFRGNDGRSLHRLLALPPHGFKHGERPR